MLAMRQVISSVWRAVARMALFIPASSPDGVVTPSELRVCRLALAAVHPRLHAMSAHVGDEEP